MMMMMMIMTIVGDGADDIILFIEGVYRKRLWWIWINITGWVPKKSTIAVFNHLLSYEVNYTLACWLMILWELKGPEWNRWQCFKPKKKLCPIPTSWFLQKEPLHFHSFTSTHHDFWGVSVSLSQFLDQRFFLISKDCCCRDPHFFRQMISNGLHELLSFQQCREFLVAASQDFSPQRASPTFSTKQWWNCRMKMWRCLGKIDESLVDSLSRFIDTWYLSFRNGNTNNCFIQETPYL